MAKVPKRPKARKEAAAAEKAGKAAARRTDVIAREGKRSGKPVKLKKNFQNEMSAADRIRFYLGLPQGYPMNPVLIKKARAKLHEKQGGQGGNLTRFESQVMFDIHSAASAQRQDERFEGYPGTAARTRSAAKESLLRQAADEEGRYSPMWNARYALQLLYGELPSEFNPDLTQTTRSGPDVFPSQEAAEAHIQRSGFRGPDETVGQARARARQEAAQPQNPRMGGVKRKAGY